MILLLRKLDEESESASSVADPPKSPSEQPDETGSSRISSLGLFVLPL